MQDEEVVVKTTWFRFWADDGLPQPMAEEGGDGEEEAADGDEEEGAAGEERDDGEMMFEVLRRFPYAVDLRALSPSSRL